MARDPGGDADAGSGTVLGLILALCAVFLLGVVLAVGQAAILTERAGGAGDLAALAAADTARGLRIGEPCEAAEEIARANGAELTECTVIDPERTTVDVQVGIDLPPALNGFGQATGHSRAGPPEDSPFS